MSTKVNKNRDNVWYTKEQEMSKIKEALKGFREGKYWNVNEMKDLRQPISVVKHTYLEMIMHQNGKDKEGFSVEVDDCTQKILNARWFCKKDNVNQEVELDADELRYLDKTYGLTEDMSLHFYCKEI